MTSHDAPGSETRPGTVAEEAALLVDLLSQRGWGGSSRTPSAPPDANGQSAGGSAHDTSGHSAGDPTDRPSNSGSECTCGGTTPAACRVCPVCQLIAFVQQVNPDTIDRVADFVGFAATALRDLATAQRERRPEAGDDETDTTRRGDPS